MNRPEPIELENNLGPDAVTGEINRVPWMAYDVDEMDLYIDEKDKEIAELKKKLMPCLNGDCILTCEVVEKYGKENAELKAEIESLKASHYAEMVDAGMRERRLRRALWLARENSADGQFIYWCARFGVESGFTKADIRGYSVNTKRRLRTIGEWIETWKNVRTKCLKKAEEYK